MSSSVDPRKNYYVEFMKNVVNLRDFERRLIRKFVMKTDVVNAQVLGSGDNTNVAIVMKDGKTWVYSSDGRLIRK